MGVLNVSFQYLHILKFKRKVGLYELSKFSNDSLTGTIFLTCMLLFTPKYTAVFIFILLYNITLSFIISYDKLSCPIPFAVLGNTYFFNLKM